MWQELQPHFGRRGRRACEVQSPVLADVVTEILDAQSQADPKFQTNVLFTRATGKFLRSLLESHPDLADARPPSVRTCQRLMNRLGFRLRFVQKARPLKKIPETDAIFTHLDRLHDAIESDPTVLRISVDTKAKVAVGPYCRHGRCRSRTSVKAADHDMHPEAKLVPLGILEVDSGQLFLSLGQSAETSDFIADGIEDWWLTRREAHRGVRKIVIDLDNGPNVQSHRTQFMKRLIEFSDKHPVEIELAYYPPYHSKYNPVERCWSSLERHWNGTLLIDVDTVVKWAKTMSWRGLTPIVQLATATYERGKRIGKQAFATLAKRLQRSQTLPRWSVVIEPLREGWAPSG